MSKAYSDSGVDIHQGEKFVEKISSILNRYKVNDERVISGVGGFASLYEMGDRLLAAATDGVGTKLKIAHQLDSYTGLGQDLLAMCANDIVCTGAKPLFFLDYLACGKLNPHRDAQIIEGLAKSCFDISCVLIGGETAEMPGCYPEDGFDLAGFCVGEVSKDRIIDGQNIKQGDSLIGLSSNGIHSNGLSFFRKWVDYNRTEILEEALRPTFLYSKIINDVLDEISYSDAACIKGIAHITGGGLRNISRVIPSEDLQVQITNLIDPDQVSSVFSYLRDSSGVDYKQLYEILNMGVGMVLITSRPDDLFNLLQTKIQELGLLMSPFLMGEVTKKQIESDPDICVNTNDLNFEY